MSSSATTSTASLGIVTLRSRGQLSAVEQDEELQRALIKPSNILIRADATRTNFLHAAVDDHRLGNRCLRTSIQPTSLVPPKPPASSGSPTRQA